MNYFVGGGQIVVGLGLLVAWWITLTFIGVRNRGRPMTSIGFAVVPSLFLLWLVASFILILRGAGEL
jgi:hypothetical protein